MLLRACLVVCTFALSCAVYEDQVGEYDWQIQNVGLVKYSIFASHKIFVATEEGVIAALNPVTSKVDWRVLLPKGF